MPNFLLRERRGLPSVRKHPVCSLQTASAPCRRHTPLRVVCRKEGFYCTAIRRCDVIHAAFSFGGGFGSSPTCLLNHRLPDLKNKNALVIFTTGATGLEPAISGLTGQRDKPASLRPQCFYKLAKIGDLVKCNSA